jgi:hypothetical protein
MTKKGYIYDDQGALFGSPDVIGFGSSDWNVKEIERNLANEIIVKNHYSGNFYKATYIHLGVFIDGELLGVLQYGYAMNPASCSSVVAGTERDEYLELNRMWLDDKAARNSESRAISYSFKYIKGRYPKIKWVQSFADERCGGFGLVYQACSFGFYGEHKSLFWTLDGEVFHNSLMTRNPELSKSAKKLQENKERATSEELRQFRYIRFINKRYKGKCLLDEKPYLKYYNGD